MAVFKENLFPDSGPVFLQPMAFPENAQTLAGIAFLSGIQEEFVKIAEVFW